MRDDSGQRRQPNAEDLSSMKLSPIDVFDALKSGALLSTREIEYALDTAERIHSQLPTHEQVASKERIDYLTGELKKRRGEMP
jgi:hypothetical protein